MSAAISDCGLEAGVLGRDVFRLNRLRHCNDSQGVEALVCRRAMAPNPLREASRSPGRRRGEIWISSGLRRDSAGLREFPGFGRLDFLGIPWILSTEMSVFKGLCAKAAEFYSSFGPSPREKGPCPV